MHKDLFLPQWIGLNALESHLNRQDITLGIEVHLVDTGNAIITALCSEWMAVINDILLKIHML